MSTYSEAWHTMDPAVRDFYVNWALINTAQSWHAEWWEEYHQWLPFTALGQAFPGYLGFHIAQRNWGIQLFETGSFNPNVVLLTDPGPGWDTNWEPQYSSWGFPFYGSIYIVVPDYCYNYPRPKYRIRRSYWTGAPRRRRNL